MTPPHARTVLVPPARLERWVENFATRHGRADLAVRDGRVVVSGDDGERAEVALPFGRRYDGPADLPGVAAAAAPPDGWGLLLVRKGGFAVALVAGEKIAGSKVGQRHVQGRTKAGGQSQQRFARRRDNQARQAYEAAADHAHRVLLADAGLAVTALVCGGDRTAVEQVLHDPRLAALQAVRVDPWLPVPDPRRSVLEQAVRDGGSLQIFVSQGEPVPPT